MSTEEKRTNNIKIPNTDLDKLRQHFPHCFDKEGNFQIQKFQQNLVDKEVNFSSESYGMDWLGKSYARLLASDPATTLLKADENHNQKLENSKAQNLLLKGDNLEVLKHLTNAYYEKIKMIYIDPPYNTGSDGFVYQDDRKFTAKELQDLAGIDEERAKRILAFTKSKSNSHSAWLTFMYPRLYIAKQLLKEDGVIFISIDDNEVAQLRLLMDEIFGEENFINEIIWKKNSSGKTVSEKYPENVDFMLMYSKTRKYELNEIYKPLAASTIKMYCKDDDDGRGKYATVSFQKTGSPGPLTTYDYVDNQGRVWDCPVKGWRLIQPKIKALENDGRIYFEGNTLREKDYWNERKNQGQIADTLWDDMPENNVGTAEVDRLLGKGIFSNPKPTKLISRCINTIVNKADLILDFFAGSGTTGDAVMQLNAEDGGNRKFILVQIPEAIDAKKSKMAYDFVKNELSPSSSGKSGETLEPTIFEITRERLIRASKKVNEELDRKSEVIEISIKKLKGQLQTEEIAAELKLLTATVAQNKVLKTQNYFKVFETMPIWEDYDVDADEFYPEMELFDESKLTENDIKALLTTWKTSDGIALTHDLIPIDLGGYASYYQNKKLYLMQRGFSTDNLAFLLEKIDSDKTFDPTSIIAFGYHFDSKDLRELAENVKSYANKKNIDIDLITRY